MDLAARLLLTALCLLAALYAWCWFATERRRGQLQPAQLGWLRTGTGFVTNFFDTLGIGSFAPTTAIFRLQRLVPDELIPGTLNVGQTLPTMAQALIFIAAISISPATLLGMIASAVAGAWLGAGVVPRMPRRRIQLVMGFALIAAAALFALMNTGLLPSGGADLGLAPVRLGVAMGANFVLGALMTAGVGLYAPCLVLVSLLGLDPIAAFPIMMGSCAFLMPVASLRFIRARSYDTRSALGLAFGGIPAVLLAAFVVKSLPLTWLRWLVVAVALYAAVSMLRTGRQN